MEKEERIYERKGTHKSERLSKSDREALREWNKLSHAEQERRIMTDRPLSESERRRLYGHERRRRKTPFYTGPAYFTKELDQALKAAE